MSSAVAAMRAGIRSTLLSYAAVGAALLTLAACGGPSDRLERSGEPTVFYVDDDDPEMQAAMAQARATIDTFRARLRQPPPSQSHLSLKVRVGTESEGEHLWLTNVQETADGFRGEVGNEPADTDGLALGDTVTVKPDEVSDWMAIDAGRLVGGYTVRLLRKRMSEDERRAVDAEMPFRVDEER